MMLRWVLLGLLGLGTAHAADMIALRYQDQDPGTPASLTRILVTPDFMRMDGGEDAGDFVLLDRRQRTVFNVMHDNRMAMVFKPGTLPAKPAGWKSRLDVRKAGRGTQGFTLTVGGVVCSEGVAARRAAPDAARAMAEFKAVLASMQYRVWQETPPGMQHNCDLANQVWETGTTLKLGLPLEEREFTGRTRTFESETRLPLKPRLFRVPDGMPLVNAPS
ncbi:MAG: hypothetical protein Q8J70_07060 [Thiobacillus sp.]|nr:hypothetical protein [Thiobacillus sp.]